VIGESGRKAAEPFGIWPKQIKKQLALKAADLLILQRFLKSPVGTGKS